MRRRILISLLLVLPLVAGCRSAPSTHYYVLAPASAPAVVATGSGDVRVGVEPFTVDPPYDSDRLVYRLGTDSVEVGFYAYHRWAAPLGDLVAVAFAEGLRGTPGIGTIEPVTSGGEYTAFLRGRVVYLEEIDLPGQQEARLGFEIRLVDRDGATLWADEVSGSSSGQAQTVEGIVRQLYQAFEQALDQARSGLSATDLSASD